MVVKAPAFQLYAQDFDMDTAAWSASEVGIYMRLLMYEWINGALPSDTKSLARICRMDGGNFSKCWCPNVKGKFIANASGELVNRRLEAERQKQLNYRETQSIKGKVGNEKRWGNHRRGDSNCDGKCDHPDIALLSSVFRTSKPKDFTSPKPATVTPKKPLSKSSSLTHRLVGRFSEAYEKTTGQVYAMSPGRDGKLMRDIAAALANGGGMEESEIEAHVVAAIARFFDDGHRFKGNMDIPQFKRAFNRLQVAPRSRAGPNPDDPLWVKTQKQPEGSHDA